MEPTKVLAGPAFIDGAAVRLVADGELARVEVWGPKGWEPGKFSVGEVLKAPPASEETLSKLGVQSDDIS